MVTLEKNTVSQERMSQNKSCRHQEVTVGRTHSTHIPSSHFFFSFWPPPVSQAPTSKVSDGSYTQQRGALMRQGQEGTIVIPRRESTSS